MDEIKASPTKPGQELLGKIGQVAEKLGIKVEEAMKIVNQEGNSPVKAFIMNMLVSEPLKSAGTALQDWTGTPRDATEDYPYRRLVSGKGMTASLDPRILDVAPIAGAAASRVAHGIKHLPTDLMKAATAAYGPQATAAHVVKPTDKSIKEMIDEIRKTQGAYEAKRLERAADEVPNLERLYQPEALQSLFRGDNAKGIMTMRPGEFERYATPLDYDPKSPKHFMFGEAVDPVKGSTPKGLTQEQYIQYLSGLKGFEDVPFLEVNKTKSNKLAITGHEGRHRSRALDAAGEKAGLVQFYPRASLREDFPRRHRDEYIDALREELERHGRMVTPQSDMSPEGVIIRPDIELPDVYKGGGPVQKSAGGRMAKSIGAMAAELSKKRAVLPKEEAEANLRKMLESSKVQQRLYHGTTATEGGKGQEAIRRFKPSKEGALGSGSYLTPAPSYASGYADQAGGNILPVYAQIKNPLVIEGKGDPMIEALIKLGMDEDKASRMVERAYENKGYIGKEVESRARAAGYDGLMQYRDGELSEVVSYNPNAIKSAIGNVGTYDTSVPDLSKAEGGPVHKQDGGIMEAIEAAKKSGKPRAKIPLGGRVDIEQMRREVEENARRVAEVKKELATTETKYSPSLKFLPKGTPESIRYAFEKAAKDAGPSMQVAQVDGKPVGVTSEPGGFGEALSSAGALLDIPSIAAGEETFTRTGSPALAAAAYTLTDPIGAVLGAPAAGRAAIKGAKALAPKLGETAEQYMFRTGMALPMDVWHGSPHRFPPAAKNPLGEFDPTKIGTGEGAQAFGHGHYLAEARGTGEIYRKKLAPGYDRLVDGVPYDSSIPAHLASHYVDMFSKRGKTPEQIAELLIKEGGTPVDQEAAKIVLSGNVGKYEKPPAGSLYKVDLPDEQIAKMLDWDKPLSEQPESVQKVLKDLAERDAKMYGEGGGLDYYMGDPESYSGESVYRYLTEQLSGQPETSSFFKEAGIPGIKYFDAASRDAGEGTRNFVVFPGGEEMLTIKERMKDGGVAHKAGGGVLRRLAKYGKQYEPSKKTEIFIGEKSPMWNAGAAGKAVELEKAGVAPVDIWKQTGTFRSPDGDLRQEISDVGSKFRGEKEMKELASSMKQQEADIKQKIKDSKEHPDLFPKQLKTAQGELRQQAKDIKARRTMESGPEARVGRGNRAEFALEHPELYEAYPLLSGMDVQQGGRSGSALGSYIRGIDERDPGMVNIYDRGLANDPRSTMIHEAQHAIQDIEGWGRGGNPEMAFQNPEAIKILENLRNEALKPMTYEEFFDKFKGSGIESMSPSDAIKHYELYKQRIPEKVKQIDRELQSQAAQLYYERLAGEAESRAAQARRDLTPEQRLEKFPLEVGDYGYDVKPEDIIVKRNKKGGQVSLDAMRLAVGGGLKSGIKAAKKIGDYVDPKSSKINKWKWRPLGDVQKDIGITEIPEYIQGGFGDLMADQLKRANAGDLSARDFLKAYGITQSSIGREGRSYNTATKAGLKLPKQDYIRPEGAFAEWLGSKAGQRFLDKAEQGVTDENALKQLREQFSPFGMSNALTDRLRWGINYAAENPDIANKFATSSVPDYRDLMLDIKGIGPAKSGFIGSMLGRGDLPTLDARQVLLHTGKYSSHPDFAKFTRPVVGGKPVAANESVDRLIARQEAMDADIDEALEPFYQHLMHHAVWDKAGGSKTTHEDLVRAMKDYKKGGEVSIDAMRLAVGGMAGGGRSSLIRGGIETVSKGLKSAEKAKQYATPAKFERAPAKTKAEVEALAQRMAPQFLGEFVRKPESTFSVAGKSMKQYRREKDLPIVYGGERPTPDVFDITKHEGEMMVGVPGDPTIAHRTLEQIGDIRPDAPVELHGGPLYGLEGEFWASGKGPATGLQAVARRGSEAYGGVPVVGQYIRMPEGTPYALHTTDALLSFQRPEMLGKRKLEQLNAEIRRGNLKNKFPEFVGFEDPDLVLLQAQDNPNLRKHINNVLLKPTTAEKYGLYPGPDIDAAITEAGLRNLETGATGFSVGRLFPESKLIESAHPTYEFDIPGRMIGQTKYPQPYELTFPDALKFAREGLKPGVGEFGMLKMIGPRQIIDAQLVDEINMYQEAMKKLTGKKKGGTIKKAVGGGVMSAGQKLAKAFVEAGKKAKLPEQAKEAASKGELFLPDEEVKRMQRELLQGVKKPEEFAVGGQITSDDLILEERPL